MGISEVRRRDVRRCDRAGRRARMALWWTDSFCSWLHPPPTSAPPPVTTLTARHHIAMRAVSECRVESRRLKWQMAELVEVTAFDAHRKRKKVPKRGKRDLSIKMTTRRELQTRGASETICLLPSEGNSCAAAGRGQSGGRTKVVGWRRRERRPSMRWRRLMRRWLLHGLLDCTRRGG